MTPTLHHTPRRHLLYRASPGRPLLVCLGGFTNRIDPPGTRAVSFGQWNANFVDESKLLDLAERRDCSVVFISSAPRSRWTPWWRRNWSADDLPEAIAIVRDVRAKVRPSVVLPFGFSDGATFAHELAAEMDLPACVAHSGLVPTRCARACLLVCGSEDRAPGVKAAQAEVETMYHDAGRPVCLWGVEGGHEWAWQYNDEMLARCERFLLEMADENHLSRHRRRAE